MKLELVDGLISQGPNYLLGLIGKIVVYYCILDEFRLIKLLRNSSFRWSDPKLGFYLGVKSLQNDDFLKSKDLFNDECYD